MNDPASREVLVFSEALALPAGERDCYLDEACGDDATERRPRDVLPSEVHTDQHADEAGGDGAHEGGDVERATFRQWSPSEDGAHALSAFEAPIHFLPVHVGEESVDVFGDASAKVHLIAMFVHVHHE